MTMLADNVKALVMASFAADALSLGPHWIYDLKILNEKYGRIESLTDPLPNSFHPNKKAGDFTHYGDQTLVLLESIAHCNTFDLNHFAHVWQDFFISYNGYFDNATKTTLANFKKKASPQTSGSPSTDLAGACRIAPLVYLFYQDETQLVESTRRQTKMTHNNELVSDCAVFFALAALKILGGASPIDAVQSIAETNFDANPLSMLVQKGVASRNKNTQSAISDFGQMCDSNAALPGTIHLICKYPDNLSSALVENAMAGGDSAARGMLCAMLLGAHLGSSAIPSKWIEQIKAHVKIEKLLAQIDHKK